MKKLGNCTGAEDSGSFSDSDDGECDSDGDLSTGEYGSEMAPIATPSESQLFFSYGREPMEDEQDLEMHPIYDEDENEGICKKGTNDSGTFEESRMIPISPSPNTVTRIPSSSHLLPQYGSCVSDKGDTGVTSSSPVPYLVTVCSTPCNSSCKSGDHDQLGVEKTISYDTTMTQDRSFLSSSTEDDEGWNLDLECHLVMETDRVE